MKHFEYEISQYVDNELGEQKISELFLHLSGCSNCQKVFSEYLMLKEKSKDYCAEKVSVPIKENLKFSVDDAYKSIAETGRWNLFYKSAFFASSAAAVIILFFALTNKPYRETVTSTVVKSDTVFVANQKENTTHKPVLAALPESNDQEYLKYILNLRSEEIKKSEVVEVIKGDRK